MHQPARWPYRPASTLMRLLAAFALLAQIAVVCAPVAEGRDGVGMAAHVEARGGGSPSHHTHEESTCIACQVRGFHGVALGPHIAPLAPAHQVMAPDLGLDRVASNAFVRHSLPRAPPA